MEVESIVGSALRIGREIQDMLRCNQNNNKKNGALQETQRKMKLIQGVLAMLQLIKPSSRLEERGLVAIAQQVSNKLEEVRDEIQRVQSMNTFLYLMMSKDCQERLRALLDSLHFYLISIEFPSDTAVVVETLLGTEWDSIMDQDPELAKQLQQERTQAENLQRKVLDAKEELDLKEIQLQLPPLHYQMLGALIGPDIQPTVSSTPLVVSQ